MALDVGVVSDIAGLEALEPPWWTLFDACPEATPFQSPAWLIAWWRAFHPGDLSTIAIRDGDRLVGLAPFYIERAIAGGRLLAVGIGLSDYLDVLVAPDCRDAVLAAIGAAVETLAGWQEWELTDMAPFAAGRGLPHLSSCACEETPAAARYGLALDGEPGRLMPGTKARKLRMAEHRARRDGGFAISKADAASLDRLLTRLIDLHHARWAARGETGVFADPRVERCHREALPSLLERGMLRLYGIERHGRITAVQLGFLHRRRAFAYAGGFDPEDAQVSPGTLLTAHAIMEAQREGCRWFDFLKGDEAHKLSWGAKRQEAFRRVWRRRGEDVVALLEGGRLPANVAVMRLAYRARSAAEVETALAAAEAAAHDAVAGQRLKAAGALWRESPAAFCAGAGGARRGRVAGRRRRWRRCGHRLRPAVRPRGSPWRRRGGGALCARPRRYSRRGDRGDRDAACGSCGCSTGEGGSSISAAAQGRVTAALAGRTAQVVGVDISPGMLAAARRRLLDRANVMLIQGSGRDLAWLEDDAMDLVLAVDVFPYLAEFGSDADRRDDGRGAAGASARRIADGAQLVLSRRPGRRPTTGGARSDAQRSHAAGGRSCRAPPVGCVAVSFCEAGGSRR